jgi:hypothetical protein
MPMRITAATNANSKLIQMVNTILDKSPSFFYEVVDIRFVQKHRSQARRSHRPSFRLSQLVLPEAVTRWNRPCRVTM